MSDNVRMYKVEKERLLRILRDNQVKHVTQYNQAKAVYRAKAIEALALEIAKARDGLAFSMHFNLEEPHSYAKAYDAAISLLGMTIGDVVEITIAEHRQYVLDEWGWTREFREVNRTYLGEEAND